MLSTAEWITILTTLITVGVGAGALTARVRMLESRVNVLEGGSIDRGRRMGKIGERLAVLEYKAFGRGPTSPGDVTPDRT